MDILISNLLSKSIFNFGKWSNWKFMYLRIAETAKLPKICLSFGGIMPIAQIWKVPKKKTLTWIARTQRCTIFSYLYSALHCTALHCNALHCTALQNTALHCTALVCTALHCTVLPKMYRNALHCTVLHCTALHSAFSSFLLYNVDQNAESTQSLPTFPLIKPTQSS